MGQNFVHLLSWLLPLPPRAGHSEGPSNAVRALAVSGFAARRPVAILHPRRGASLRSLVISSPGSMAANLPPRFRGASSIDCRTHRLHAWRLSR